MLTALLLAQAATPGATVADPPRDWAATLRTDARAFHEMVASDHPGPYNRLDPRFAKRNDAALALALQRARQVTGFTGYLWAMRGYVASFDDGHVQLNLKDTPSFAVRWPGFLTGFDGRNRQVVLTRTDDAPVPLGAELVACDGVNADRLAARNVGAFRGRWQLASQRGAHGGRLFVDAGNPFITLPNRCKFRIAGAERAVTLAWRDMSDGEFAARIGATMLQANPPIESRVLTDGTRWFSISSFDSDPTSTVGKSLTAMIAGMTRGRAGILAAPRIVFDLRGNGGGSSDWSRRMAEELWGSRPVAAIAVKDRSYTEWRVSRANLTLLETYRDDWLKQPDASPVAIAWAKRATAGIGHALTVGQPLWREVDPEAAAGRPDPAGDMTKPPSGPVFVLTDRACASACLDAVDLWTALGAVVVGQETSADTLYMEVGGGPLPGGVADAGVPMKMYRGRARGNNQPVVPRYRYDGDMRDTAALERWMSTLPTR